MGEHLNNENAKAKAEAEVKGEAAATDEKSVPVSPINGENIMIITELAHIGLNMLNLQLPEMKKVSETEGAAITPQIYEHFRSLASVGGDTITHFHNICQYLVDASAELEKLKESVKGE